MLKLSVVILNYRTPDLAIAAAESALADLPPNSALVLVDNASPDDSADRFAAWRSSKPADAPIRVVVSPANTGYSGGNNLGMASCEAEHYLLMNSDAVIRAGAVPKLLAAMEKDSTIGIVGPRLIGPDGKPLISRFRTPTPISEFVEASGADIFFRMFRNHVVPMADDDSAVPGWIGFPCILLRGKMVREIGPLDESYFMYFEDISYCRRAARAGWRLAYCREATVDHLCGKSSDVESLAQRKQRLPAYYYASRTRFFRSHYGIAGYVAANVLWYAGRAVSYARILALKAPTKVPKRRGADIWTGPDKGRPGRAA